MSDIKVSVNVLSYKHAKYIRQCIDSILAQKVNFKYEIVVGEDCSNDGTKEILLEYKEKYPDKFVLLLNEENMGVSKNSYNVKLYCSGEYITGCESDDFWTDEYKLQKQVDFLDAHPEYIAVGSNSVAVDENGKNPRVHLFPWQVNKRYTMKHYIKYGYIIHGNTLMYRNVLPYRDEKYAQLRFAEPTMPDVINRISLYDRGDIYVMPDITHAHRSGDAAPTSFTAQQKTRALELTEMYFRIVNNITAYFDGKYDLEPLKANRVASILRSKMTGSLPIEKEAFRALWRKLPFRLKWLSLCRCCQKSLRRMLHRVAGKLMKNRATQ